MKPTLAGRLAAACLALTCAFTLLGPPAARAAPDSMPYNGSAKATPAGMVDNTGVQVPATTGSAKIDMSTATTTQLVAASGTTSIYVTSWNVVAGGTGNFSLVYGTGTNCGTGTTALTGAYPLVAQAGVATGGGLGAVLVAPAGKALCGTSSAAVQMSGSVAYAQY